MPATKGTTSLGYVNRNQQGVVARTDLQGTDHLQYVYELSCSRRGHHYGANGSDIRQRKCPEGQGGAPGLAYWGESAEVGLVAATGRALADAGTGAIAFAPSEGLTLPLGLRGLQDATRGGTVAEGRESSKAGVSRPPLDEVLVVQANLPQPGWDRSADRDSGGDWLVGFSRDFRANLTKLDAKLLGRVLRAIVELARDPVTPLGDTIKPLKGELAGSWRYRIGDYRLVYHPDVDMRRVVLVDLAARGAIYEQIAPIASRNQITQWPTDDSPHNGLLPFLAHPGLLHFPRLAALLPVVRPRA